MLIAVDKSILPVVWGSLQSFLCVDIDSWLSIGQGKQKECWTLYPHFESSTCLGLVLKGRTVLPRKTQC